MIIRLTEETDKFIRQHALMSSSIETTMKQLEAQFPFTGKVFNRDQVESRLKRYAMSDDDYGFVIKETASFLFFAIDNQVHFLPFFFELFVQALTFFSSFDIFPLFS